jgi:oligosaccharide repeat unit polymerase
MLAAAVGILCITAGHYWAIKRPWGLALPEFIDARAPGPRSLYRWALFMLIAGLIPVLATGVYNPITLLTELLHGRLVHGNAAILFTSGGYFAFVNVLSNLVPLGATAAAILFWRRSRAILPVALTAFFAIMLMLTGTRSSAAEILAPFVLLPRYFGNRRLFWKLAAVGAVLGFVVFSVQLVYRSIGFQHVQVSRALAKASPLEVLEGNQLAWTGQAMYDYGNLFHYIHGDSYLAVMVNPVPRVFWPDKPIGYSKTNANNLGYAIDVTMTSAWMGEAYANFGWLGIPVVGLVAGILMGILDVFIGRSGPLALAIFIPLQLRWAYWVRGDSVFSLDYWLFGFIVIMGFFALVGPARGGAEAGWAGRDSRAAA